MSDVAAADLRAQLEAERDDLRRQLAELGGLDYDSNFADSSQVTAERGEAEVLVAKLRTTLDDVEHALAKEAEGAFGLCESCHKPIPAARLEAMPAARLCIDCASKR
jgi:DnaK suppressor protein